MRNLQLYFEKYRLSILLANLTILLNCNSDEFLFDIIKPCAFYTMSLKIVSIHENLIIFIY